MAELPRQSRRLRGQPPEYTPSQLEGLKALVTSSESRVGSPEARESSLVIHPDYHVPATEYISEPLSVSELTDSFSYTGELIEEPEISEPETESTATPSSRFASPVSSAPGSPRVGSVITQNLPIGLNSIGELVIPDEDINPLEINRL